MNWLLIIENLSDFELSCVVAAALNELDALSLSSPILLMSGDSSNVTLRFYFIFIGERFSFSSGLQNR